MSIKRRGRRRLLKLGIREIEPTPDLAARTILGFAWHIAEEQGFCPLCLMNMVAEMVAAAEKAGAIRHTDESRPTHETLQ